MRIAFTVLLFGLMASSCLGQGITDPVVFPPFDPDAPNCAAPEGLSNNLMFFQDNDREFMQGVSAGLSAAAEDRGLGYSVALANDDENRMIEDIRAAIAENTGAFVASPVNPSSLAAPLIEAIGSGAFVGTVVPPPAITILNAPQYLTGQRLAEAAMDYIKSDLGGRANVVLLTHDSLEFLAPRFTAMRDVLGRLPGVTIVADISPSPVNTEGGYEMMKLILLAHPDIDVVLGADTVVLGALKALREAGKARADQFIGGIDGEPEALAELADPSSPYKVSISLASPIFGYALGSFAADWLEGQSVPQAMDILPTVLTPENLADYQGDLADPGAVFSDSAHLSDYMRFYGNICADRRDQFVNFAWSSERGG